MRAVQVYHRELIAAIRFLMEKKIGQVGVAVKKPFRMKKHKIVNQSVEQLRVGVQKCDI